MSTFKCPKGHESTEPDYCSECGAKINGVPKLTSSANPLNSTLRQTDQSVITCPDCTAPHEPDSGDFCEICGYNFISGAHGEVPPVPLTPIPVAEATPAEEGESSFTPELPPATLPSPQLLTKAAVPSSLALELVITIDPSLRTPDSPPAPPDQAPIAFRLEKETNLIGRSSTLQGIQPEIALDLDDAVSRRHALLLRQPDGTLKLRDIGSSNGTKLNDVELPPMVDTPIKEGDEITLGHWTRIVVKAIQPLGGSGG
ncbi:MAG TPA: FHA domain-containing protein [Waterburya sp.]|jgi:hypothetical protein